MSEYGKLIQRLKVESGNQQGWASEGESTVVGNGPHLLTLAAATIQALETENAALKERVGELESGARDIIDLINQSEGVAGFNLNGDVEPWENLMADGSNYGWLENFWAAQDKDDE